MDAVDAGYESAHLTPFTGWKVSPIHIVPDVVTDTMALHKAWPLASLHPALPLHVRWYGRLNRLPHCTVETVSQAGLAGDRVAGDNQREDWGRRPDRPMSLLGRMAVRLNAGGFQPLGLNMPSSTLGSQANGIAVAKT